MLGFRWKKHTTTTYMGSGRKNTQLQHAWIQVGKTHKLRHAWVQVEKTHNYNMLVFRWKKHTTTTCLSSGGKNTTTTCLGSGGKTDKLKHAWVQVGNHTTTTCLGSGGKNTQLQHAWVQVGKTDKLKKTWLEFRWKKHTSNNMRNKLYKC